jgi:hypothetical protein
MKVAWSADGEAVGKQKSFAASSYPLPLGLETIWQNYHSIPQGRRKFLLSVSKPKKDGGIGEKQS